MNAVIMTNAVEHSRVMDAAFCGILLCSLLLCSQTEAAEQVYPISGVWVAVDEGFPAAAGEACLAVKTFGIEAASRKDVAGLTIFSSDQRYDLKGVTEIEQRSKRSSQLIMAFG
jgi:hypothetical protein